MTAMAANSYLYIEFGNNSGGNVGFTNTSATGPMSTIQIARVC